MKDFIRENPVRVRAGLAAVLALLVSAVPALAGLNVEVVSGVASAFIIAWAGVSAGKRVVTHATDAASSAEAAAQCCACPHALPEPTEPADTPRTALYPKP